MVRIAFARWLKYISGKKINTQLFVTNRVTHRDFTFAKLLFRLLPSSRVMKTLSPVVVLEFLCLFKILLIS